MTGIHDVFPQDDNDSNDPISEKKLKQGDGEYATTIDPNFLRRASENLSLKASL